MHLQIFQGCLTKKCQKNTQRLNEVAVNVGNFIALNSLFCSSNKTAFLQHTLRTKKKLLKERDMLDGMTDKSFYARNITLDEPKVVNKFQR